MPLLPEADSLRQLLLVRLFRPGAVLIASLPLLIKAMANGSSILHIRVTSQVAGDGLCYLVVILLRAIRRDIINDEFHLAGVNIEPKANPHRRAIGCIAHQKISTSRVTTDPVRSSAMTRPALSRTN